MKDLRSLSDHQILIQTKSLSSEERRITAQLLLFLREVERRRLFAKNGFSSLFEYVTKELGYSDASAARRIGSMRLLKDLPEIEDKIKEGSLNLSQIAQAQRFFQNELKNNNPISTKKKTEILASLEGKSTRDTERELLSKSSNPEPLMNSKMNSEKIRAVTEQFSEVKFIANQELLDQLEEIKGLLAHTHPNITFAELIAEMAKLSLAALKAKKFKVQQVSATTSTQNTNLKNTDESSSGAGAGQRVARETRVKKTEIGKVRSRYIPAAVKRSVYLRDGGMCTYVDPVSGRRCSSVHFLQFDHVKAWAKQGESNVNNLVLKCKNHNTLHAISDFGQSHMAKFVPSLR